MASPEVASAIKAVESAPAGDRPTRYSSLLQTILTSSASNNLAANLIAYAGSILGDSLGIVASRPLLAAFVEQYKQIKDAEVKVDVGQQVKELLRGKGTQYEEQDSAIKFALADAYETEEDYSKSADILKEITLDSSQKAVSGDEKAKVWIRIVRCYLEIDDPIAAIAYLNKIKNIIHNVSNGETKIHFQLSQARIYDSQRAFLDASQAYYTLSLDPMIEEEERLQTLSVAFTCAILAPAGPQRGKMLAKLYKDERADQAENYGIMEKMFLDRLLEPDEVKAFAAKLQPHHLARTADGSTVLDKAVLEHNLLGVSKIYNNIYIDDLADRLGTNADKAEEYAGKMLEQGRISGYIDQVDRLIYFQGEGTGERKTGHTDNAVGQQIRRWDANVQGLAEEVEKVTTMIQNQYPDFYAEHMVH
ncbi:COP9 signalosome-like protein complex subunit 4 [Polyplosphaeria fusca]|uniref:COP9 signalosome complex subunit 4 n=1 Tax=Polyplosphaeria fusca TaxID=682080 RepID=A0A9P4R5K0_9PLEO|nr:COP9 signalosome-like protein complex subunit 4 [Polyplosphaeria fusca]